MGVVAHVVSGLTRLVHALLQILILDVLQGQQIVVVGQRGVFLLRQQHLVGHMIARQGTHVDDQQVYRVLNVHSDLQIAVTGKIQMIIPNSIEGGGDDPEEPPVLGLDGDVGGEILTDVEDDGQGDDQVHNHHTHR